MTHPIHGEDGGFGHRFDAADGAEVEVTWQGHVDARGLQRFCVALERRVGGFERYGVAIDARGVTGYDPEARALALRWARSGVARRCVAVAVVCDSELVAAESPATALAPPRVARLVGTADAARWHVRSQVRGTSGEYAATGGPTGAVLAVGRSAR